MEAAAGSGRSGALAASENGGDGNRSSRSARAVAPAGDGARDVDRLGRRPAFAIPRGFSRKFGLRGRDGTKRVSSVNRRVHEKCGRWRDVGRGGGTGWNRPEEEYSVGRPARASSATHGEAARARGTAFAESLARHPRLTMTPDSWERRHGSRSDEEYSVNRTARASLATRVEAARTRNTAFVEPPAPRPRLTRTPGTGAARTRNTALVEPLARRHDWR